MSTLSTYNVKNPDSASDNLQLDANGYVAVQAGAASTPSLYITGDANTGFWGPTADTLAISTGGSERLRVDSSGRLLVGTSSAPTGGIYATNSLISVKGFVGFSTGVGIINISGGMAASSVVSGTEISVIACSDASGNEYATIKCVGDGTGASGDYPGRLVFSTTADGASTPTERMRITSDAYVRLASSTGGIQFNGNTAAANALDDYEEGTFTPVFRDGPSGTAATASTAYGNYTKIGNCVRFQIVLVNVNTTGLSSGSTIHITGLPFTGFSGNNVEQSFPAVFNSGSVAAGYVTMQIPSGATYGILVTNRTTGQAAIPVSAASSGSFDTWVAGVYFV